ncbi:enoyl-CoA hydratase/isomerase family protein [Effusibacillus consociatus]|uniref:Enoyl-CoA hydratase/isomerase family protein n=1 Tax=Effusibacillus consociatus TaxID=1117041 RepID=A0ABV9Q682_9BACL
MKSYETIDFYKQEGTARLILKRPPVNVLTIQMMEEIVDALESIRKDNNLHALAISSEGKAFSAGVAVEDHMGEKAEPMLHLFHKMFHLLVELPCPTIAVVNGVALGGGFELAAFCDLVIATEKAKFGQPEINLALFPPVSAVIFPWLTGFNRTMELLLLGETIDARKAYEWGFVNRIVSEEDLEKNVGEILANLRSKSTVALRLTRKAVREAMASSFAGSIGKVEQIYFRELIQSDDAQEGLRSFLEKRSPVGKNS